MVHLVAGDTGVADDAGGVHDERGGARHVDRVVVQRDVDAPALGARAILVGQDREWEGVLGQPSGDAFALLAHDDEDVEGVGLKLVKAVAQLRDAAGAVGSPGAAVEFDQERAGAGGGEVEGRAGRGRSGERWGGVACGQWSTLTATVTPSRRGTSVVAKSGEA